jgi:hypothetical protein
MSNANGFLGTGRVVIPPVDPDAWHRTGSVETGQMEDDFGWIASAEAATEVGADDGFGPIEGFMSWPALLSAVVVLVAMLSAIFWPH